MTPLDDADLAIIDVKIIDIKRDFPRMTATERGMFDVICQLNEYVHAERAKVRDIEPELLELESQRDSLYNIISDLEDRVLELEDQLEELEDE